MQRKFNFNLKYVEIHVLLLGCIHHFKSDLINNIHCECRRKRADFGQYDNNSVVELSYGVEAPREGPGG